MFTYFSAGTSKFLYKIQRAHSPFKKTYQSPYSLKNAQGVLQVLEQTCLDPVVRFSVHNNFFKKIDINLINPNNP